VAGEVIAMTDQTVPQIEAPTEVWRVRCRKCAAYSRLAYSILDSRRGGPARIFYRCTACGDLVWDEDEERIQRA
jgi:DNA-directed RNA polymerase subunit M/transcription elongation factor TFIIS